MLRTSDDESLSSLPSRNSSSRPPLTPTQSRRSRPSADAKLILREAERTSDSQSLRRSAHLVAAQPTNATKAWVAAHQCLRRRGLQFSDRLRQWPHEDYELSVRCRWLGPQSQFASSGRTLF